MKRCKRCNRVLKNKESIQLGYGKTCYRIFLLNNQPEKIFPIIEKISELEKLIRKLELDNIFMKHQLKHKVISNNSKFESIERIKQVNKKFIDEKALKMQECFNEFKKIIDKGEFNLIHVPKNELRHIYNFQSGGVVV